MVLDEGSRLMGEVGYTAFSARELARRIGYSVSTVINALGGNDQLVMAINTRTFSAWTHVIQVRLERDGGDRLERLVAGYFDFADRNPRLWMAIYEHHLPEGMTIPEDQQEVRGRLVNIIVDEVAAALPPSRAGEAPHLARSLIATVHGHCHMWIAGSMKLMGEDDPLGHAIDRVRDAIGQRTRRE